MRMTVQIESFTDVQCRPCVRHIVRSVEIRDPPPRIAENLKVHMKFQRNVDGETKSPMFFVFELHHMKCLFSCF